MAKKLAKATNSNTSEQMIFDYSRFGEDAAKLVELTEEIKSNFKESYIQLVTYMVEIGNKLIAVKEILQHGEFLEWIDAELTPSCGFNYFKVNNIINLSKEYQNVIGTEREDKFHLIASTELAAIYRLSTAEESIKDAIYEATTESKIPNRKQIEQAKALVRQWNVDQRNIADEAKALLALTPIAEDDRELGKIEGLSKKKQIVVAKAIASGSAASTKEALGQLSETADKQTVDVDAVTVTVTDAKDFVKRYSGKPLATLKKLPGESINLAIVEAPLKFEWVQLEFPTLLQGLESALCPGGIAIISMGHKAICATYDVVEANGLHVLQPLVLRLQPGRTSTIIGVNIMTASRLALCCYKSPYRQPESLVVDLQTVGQENEVQTSVESGIEAGFGKFMQQLGHEDDVVGHIQLDASLNFGMRDYLIQTARSFARQFITVG